MRIIFFGTPDFSIPALKSLLESGFEIVGVFTELARPVGRHQKIIPSPVEIFAIRSRALFEPEPQSRRHGRGAKKNNLPIFTPEDAKSPEVAAQIKSLAPDIAVVAAYGQILPKELLKIPKFGFINIHPSLLPKYRGASPVQSAILNGETETGVTIMLMDAKMDHGPLLAKEKISIGDDEDTPSLLARTAELGAKMLPQVITDFVAGKIKPTEQNHEAATFTKILKKEDGQINWQKSATEIYNQIRALRPWPGTWSIFGIKNYELRIKILDGRPAEGSPSDIAAGDFFTIPDSQLAVKCGQGALIITKLVPEGKKEMSGAEFIRGYLK